MNVSMMDSYDLAWKLMYSLNGLTPDSRSLLDSYEVDRRDNALNLIDFDKRWYEHTYSNPNGAPSTFMVKEMGEFFSGCGNEYKESWLVDRNHQGRPSPVTGSDYWAGVLREGRRLFDVAVFRFADGCPYHIQDDFPSDGRFRILVLASTDLLDTSGRSEMTLTHLCTKVVPRFLPGLVELVILQPLDRHSFQWTDIAPCVKETAEMRFHHGPETAYAAYGIDSAVGALVVVRPDGIVGIIANLEDTARVDQYLRRVLKV
jgi:phenol 2-monooxygenase